MTSLPRNTTLRAGLCCIWYAALPYLSSLYRGSLLHDVPIRLLAHQLPHCQMSETQPCCRCWPCVVAAEADLCGSPHVRHQLWHSCDLMAVCTGLTSDSGDPTFT